MKKSIESLASSFKRVIKQMVPKTEPAFLDIPATPHRVAKMWKDELLRSYEPHARDALNESFTTFPSQGKHEMVIEKDIPFYSCCAHHMVPFFGECHIGYIPGERIAGLSKLPRVVEFSSRMFQTQERMSSMIADILDELLEPKGLIVITGARHLCMEMRGVQKPGVVTRVSALRGIATEQAVRNEFYSLISMK